MSWDILGSYGDTAAMFDAAAASNSSPQQATPAWDGTVDLNSVDLSNEVPAPNGAEDGQWADFWRTAGKTALGYAIAKDAKQSGVQTTTGGGTTAGQRAATTATTKVQNAWQPLMLAAGALIIGAAIWFAARRA
jgi:hypothetical protein